MENRYNALSSLSVGSRDQVVLVKKKQIMTMYTKANIRPTYKAYVNAISDSRDQKTLAVRISFRQM